MMSEITDTSNHWPRQIHSRLHPRSPLILLGSMAVGLPTMIRRLYAFIETCGAPKYLYMTIPRFDGYEYVNKSGRCYNASSRIASVNFMKRAKLIDEEEAEVWLMQLAANKRLRNPHNDQYILEERFAFLETLCKLHHIQLKWTFNPSDASIVALHSNLGAFKNISDFMKKSFVGLPAVLDNESDRSIGPLTHAAIVRKITAPQEWDFNELSRQAQINYDWLTATYCDKKMFGET